MQTTNQLLWLHNAAGCFGTVDTIFPNVIETGFRAFELVAMIAFDPGRRLGKSIRGIPPLWSAEPLDEPLELLSADKLRLEEPH
jgi:hypothetical protein